MNLLTEFPLVAGALIALIVMAVFLLWSTPKTRNDRAWDRMNEEREQRTKERLEEIEAESEEGRLRDFFEGEEPEEPAYTDALLRRYGFVREYNPYGTDRKVRLIDTRYGSLSNRMIEVPMERVFLASHDELQLTLQKARKRINERARKQGLERYTKAGRPRKAA